MSRPPDWMREVLTPVTAALDRAQKLPIYAREGAPYAWLLDAEAQILEVRRVEHDRWTIVAAHYGAEVVRAEPFDEIELELSALWAD